MRHPIDPKVDCVFKALLGAERNRALLTHFLNAILGDALPTPIADTEILNPYNEKESLDDKLSVVDVKARDQGGRQYQIEIQLLNHSDLPSRILYGWADLYSAQLQSGEDYAVLRPTYVIWLLGEALLPDVAGYAHHFRMRDQHGRLFVDHGGIWLLELSKFDAPIVQTEQERWLKFFNEAEHLDDTTLPTWMKTGEMKQAMSTLKAFSEKEQAYHAYQARQNYLRIQRSVQRNIEEVQAKMEQERAAKEQALLATEQERAAKEQALQAKDEALAEIERLKKLLDGDPGPGQSSDERQQ